MRRHRGRYGSGGGLHRNASFCAFGKGLCILRRLIHAHSFLDTVPFQSMRKSFVKKRWPEPRFTNNVECRTKL